MKNVFSFVLALLMCLPVFGKSKIIKISVEPQTAAIYVNNTLIGYGYGEFTRPKKKNEVAIIRIECDEYSTVNTKFYRKDERNSISFKLQQDGFYRASAASGLVNKFITVTLDQQYYNKNNDGTVDVSKAWKLLHQILLNYYPEIKTTDYSGGYVQTPWNYKKFSLSDKMIRTRVTVRDITTSDRVAFQIKISSEIAGAMAARNGEFTEVSRIPKEMEPMIEELQNRIGKASSL